MDETLLPLTPSDVKKVKVRVDEAHDQVTATPPVLNMGSLHFQQIEWKIETDGWVFPEFESGIELKDGPNAQFSNGAVDPSNPAIFLMNDKNTLTADHEYRIRVVKSDGTHPLELDPTIKNQG